MNELTRKSIPLESGHLSCEVRRGPGPVLLLIPGSFADNREWDEVLVGLDPELSLVLLELRGHGQSWPPPEPEHSSIEQFARDVLTAINTLKLPPLYVGGHSIGGMVALEVGLQRPAALKGVISIEGWTYARVMQDAFDGLKCNTLSDEQFARKAEMRRLATGRWSDAQRKRFGRIWQQWDGSEFLRTTQLPVMEIWGDRGREERPTWEQLGIPRRENVRVHWIPNASHTLPLECPAETAAAIMSFISATEAGQGPCQNGE